MVQIGLETLVPCVVVAGPPNSGKTTFVHQIDEALQHEPSRPLVYVVKGSPDATGRYLYYAPELREKVETELKGRWAPPQTVETICSWILNARRNLDLVIVDFGGRHSPINPAILACCTHYLVLARSFEDLEKEAKEGMDSWDRVCRDQGLLPVARIRSLWQEGEARVEESFRNDRRAIAAAYRADAADPNDLTNKPVVDAVTGRLLDLCSGRRAVPYVDLRLNRAWTPRDLASVLDLVPGLRKAVESGESVRLGGRAPIWAYLCAMHRVLDLNEQADVDVFEPKWPGAFIRIPATRDRETNEFLPDCLQVEWKSEQSRRILDLRISTPDRFLPPMMALFLHTIPLPQGQIPKHCGVTINGPGPLWLHLTYSRWLRSVGVKPIGIWDARTQSSVQVYPPVASTVAGV